MITIIPVKNASIPSHKEDFLKSVKAQASSEDAYEIVEDGVISADSKIQIYLPDDCLILANSWDKYINYAIEHGGAIDEAFVIRRLGLIARTDNGIFPGIDIKLSANSTQ